MKIYKFCETCGKKKFWFQTIEKRLIPIPMIAKPATSQKLMCERCFKAIMTALKMK